MFKVVDKDGNILTVYGTYSVPPKQFHHDGYIAFLMFDGKRNKWYYGDSDYYTPYSEEE